MKILLEYLESCLSGKRGDAEFLCVIGLFSIVIVVIGAIIAVYAGPIGLLTFIASLLILPLYRGFNNFRRTKK